ncbi:type II secretion system protein M [Thioalkalivibrio sp.]|uniref:type II secretion system protein M n=1 Tax=Thioalkalivibrio sp. TaxID=2093813 RepID=UPI0025E5187A|nr:type II secretion system protein M [Thioalkalivibrio sp.]
MTWWDGLATRERRIVMLAGLALLLVIAFLFVVEPALERRSALNSQLQTLVNEQAWMQAQVPAVRAQAGAAGAAPAARTTGSPLGVVDVSARSAGLGSALRRVRPLESAVEAELEGAPYAALVGWLATLESRHGLRVVNLSIDRGNEPGRVNAQLRIEPANGRS